MQILEEIAILLAEEYQPSMRERAGNFVSRHKGKLLTAGVLAAGAGATYAANKGYLGGEAQDQIHKLRWNVGGKLDDATQKARDAITDVKKYKLPGAAEDEKTKHAFQNIGSKVTRAVALANDQYQAGRFGG